MLPPVDRVKARLQARGLIGRRKSGNIRIKEIDAKTKDTKTKPKPTTNSKDKS